MQTTDFSRLRIAFIGLGLIGGSVARCFRKAYPGIELLAYTHTRATVEQAIAEGVVDAALSERDLRFGACDYIFLCAPVGTNLSYLPFLKEVIKPSCILTDVGSVKGEIHRAVRALSLERHFIGGHPMAGSEKTGFSNSTDSLLENAYYVASPEPEVPQEAVEEFLGLIAATRAIPLVLSSEEHDYITAGVSHLPHIIATTLVNAVQSLDTPEERMRLIAAGGFKDITRIASSSPVMWQQICLSNRDQILKVLDAYEKTLVEARELVARGDEKGLYAMFDNGREYRNSLPDIPAGPTKKQHVLYCYLLDETGGIAAVTTILASHGLNIRNVGILHNREFEEGVLRVEFYEEAPCVRGEEVLKRNGYSVYRR